MSEKGEHRNGGAMKRFRERYGRFLEWVVVALMVVLAVEVTLAVIAVLARRSGTSAST